MMAGGHMVDGSWTLTITVTDIPQDVTLRVKGDLHIGGLMLQLVEELNVALDWSDHALWLPERKLWLLRTRSTLDQYNVQADSHLWFTPMHKILLVQMPDLQVLERRLNFSSNVFSVVIKLCKELGIRHPEELSLARKLHKDELKKNRGASAFRKTRPAGLTSPNHHTSNNSMEGNFTHSPYRANTPNTPQGTLRTPKTPNSPYNTSTLGHSPHMFNANGTLSPGSMHSLSFDGAMESELSNSPHLPAKEALLNLYKPRNYAEKARINAGWLDSSRSLLEQDIGENDLVLLRFKFFSFYDLNPKYDSIRINQIYEQAKWQLISEEIDCTEEEMMMFAALQLQVQQQVGVPQPDLNGSGNQGDVDEIDAALTDLQESLEGTNVSNASDITKIPELQDELRFFKPKKFTFKSFKRYYFTFKDTQLAMYRSQMEMDQPPLATLNLRGCEVNPDVNISADRYNMKIFAAAPEGMVEWWLRASSEDQYAKWMAAFRLASKNRTMADSSAYEAEKTSIQVLLSMQHPAPISTVINTELQPEDFVCPRFIRKLKSKEVAHRILEAHANVRDMNLLESKLRYVKAWQALPEYGTTYFICKFVNPFKGELGKKEELLGITSNRLIRMELNTGDVSKTLRFSEMKTWSVNWEIKQVRVAFESANVDFQCVTADCKIVHETIGGYIFLSMRSGDKSQTLNEEMFHKLTGGWD